MSKWDISPEGVRGVLAQTEKVAREFEGQMASLNAAMQEACKQSSSSIVAEAIQEFAKRRSAQIQFVFARTGACMNAAARATNHYLAGDLEMAANAQASAITTANSSGASPATRGPQ